ncbi:MAG TPA: TraR/DksA family transcriptional regulator [Burkholderiales bacterium]|nr:TraR/DksA family transcriptional regulator [Burkholderiales bacterium]
MTELTGVQMQALEQALRARQRALLERVRDEMESSGERNYFELKGGVADTGDESAANLMADTEAAMVHRHVEELRDLEAALRRINEGAYGECSDCGAEIGFPRLKAYPTAKRCVRCQNQIEKTHTHEPAPTL